jgi:hypothetical protein
VNESFYFFKNEIKHDSIEMRWLEVTICLILLSNYAGLTLDATKSAARNPKPERQVAARVEVEQTKYEFVTATEELSVMKNILNTPGQSV